jgi:hypothetical protein
LYMKNYTKGRTSIVVIVVAILIIAVWASFGVWNTYKTKQYESKPSVDEITKTAVEQNSVSLCDSIDSFTRGVSYCSPAPGGPCPESSKNQCRLEVAVKYKNISTCDLITSEYSRYQCYLTTSKNPTVDYKLCKTIKTDTTSEVDCYAQFAALIKNPSLCSTELTGSPLSQSQMRGSCYLKYVKKIPDSNVCNTLIPKNISVSPETYKTSCLSIVSNTKSN